MRLGKSEGEMNHETVRNKLTLRNKLRALERRKVGECVSLVVVIKEGTDCMEHWVLYINNESWNTASKTNDVLYGD